MPTDNARDFLRVAAFAQIDLIMQSEPAYSLTKNTLATKAGVSSARVEAWLLDHPYAPLKPPRISAARKLWWQKHSLK